MIDIDIIKNAAMICKKSRKKARDSKQGGTDYPGQLALESYPDIFDYIFKDLDTIICVLGTNGKTTTCRMIHEILTSAGIGHAFNQEGANMETGILTAMLLDRDDNGMPINKTALLECDELAFRNIGEKMQPDIIITTNLYDDEVRLINVDNVVNILTETIGKCRNATICINSSSKPLMQLSEAISNKKIYYHVTDDEVHVEEVSFKINKIFNSQIYREDAAAACAFAYVYGTESDLIVPAIMNTTSGFGRMETVVLDNKMILFEMLKNRAGYDAFLTYAKENQTGGLLILVFWNVEPWVKAADMMQLFALYDRVLICSPFKDVEFLLEYQDATRFDIDNITDAVFCSSEKQVTVLMDYDGNIAVHNLLSLEGYIKNFWEY